MAFRGAIDIVALQGVMMPPGAIAPRGKVGGATGQAPAPTAGSHRSPQSQGEGKGCRSIPGHLDRSGDRRSIQSNLDKTQNESRLLDPGHNGA